MLRKTVQHDGGRCGCPDPPLLAAGSERPHSVSKGDRIVLGLAILILVLFRLHAFDAPLEVDECNYAYFGERLTEGDRLYVDLWDHQPPGIFMFTAGLVALFGSAPVVFRVSSLVAAAATLVLVHGLCGRVMGRRACWLAVGLFAIASSDPGMAGEGCNREIYMNLLGVAGLWFVVARQRWALLAAGVCFGVSSLIKTVVAAQWLFVAVAIVVSEARDSRAPVRDAFRSVLLFSTGPVLIWAGTFSYFWWTDRFAEFIGAVFDYNVTYGHLDVSVVQKLGGFFVHGFGDSVFRSTSVLWVAGGVGLLLLPWKRNMRFAAVVAAYGLGSLTAVCLPGWFWRHYYLLLLPPLVMGAAMVFDRLTGGGLSGGARRGVAYLFGCVVLVGTFALQWSGYLSRDPMDFVSPSYRARMAWGREQGRRVGGVTAPGDTIYVWGMDVGIYYYAGRTGASRYTMSAPLKQDSAGTAQRRARLIDDLMGKKPRLIMLTEQPIPELDRFIRQNRYAWTGGDGDRMIVLCDPDRPIENIDWTGKIGD